MRMLITCLGEILFDFVPIVEADETVGFRMFAGGSPFNIAMGTARLGQPTAFASKVSGDFFGRKLRARVQAEGIDERFLLTANNAPSTLAFVAFEAGEPAYSFYGDQAADTLLSIDDLPQALFDETAIIHIGSISLLRGTTPDTALAVFNRLSGKALLSLDPNIRPGLIHDEAGYRDLLARGFAMADLVKISAADLEWLMPGSSVEAAAATLLAYGPALVVVTRGADGSLALRADDPTIHIVPGVRVSVVDTVGAGDTFNAGLLTGLHERNVTGRAALLALPNDELHDVLRFAGIAAAINVTRAGCNPPTRSEIAAFVANQ